MEGGENGKNGENVRKIAPLEFRHEIVYATIHLQSLMGKSAQGWELKADLVSRNVKVILEFLPMSTSNFKIQPTSIDSS